MKIAIIGTRGIPNQYGGFEQLAEYLSVRLTLLNHDVTVYNSSLHPYQPDFFQNVKIVRSYDPEDKLGAAGQFIYDFNCIRHCRKQRYDVILQLGYTSSSVWSFLFPKHAKIITNMDGMEWKRSKYNALTKLFLRKAEKWAVACSDVLIADSKEIQNHLSKRYGRSSAYIPYGATVTQEKKKDFLHPYRLDANEYGLVIARMEPENNIEMIIKGYRDANVFFPLILVGSTKTRFGTYLRNRYASSSVRFLESIYDMDILNALRFYSKLYFHGHSVGGTNPSLLEAMASGAYIVAHNNAFNRYVLESDALYFKNDTDICLILKEQLSETGRQEKIANNLKKIQTHYTWECISHAYNKTLTEACLV